MRRSTVLNFSFSVNVPCLRFKPTYSNQCQIANLENCPTSLKVRLHVRFNSAFMQHDFALYCTMRFQRPRMQKPREKTHLKAADVDNSVSIHEFLSFLRFENIYFSFSNCLVVCILGATTLVRIKIKRHLPKQ